MCTLVTCTCILHTAIQSLLEIKGTLRDQVSVANSLLLCLKCTLDGWMMPVRLNEIVTDKRDCN